MCSTDFFYTISIDMRKLLFLLLPILFFYVAYLHSFDSRELIEPDEMRHAEIAREMVINGDWIVPHLAGVRYFDKPAMGYWLHALSIQAFGENNFAVRLPSVAAVGGTAFFIFLLVWQACWRSRPKKNRKERAKEKKEATAKGIPFFSLTEPVVLASLAALIYLSTAPVFAIGTTASLDSIFTFFLTGTTFFFFLALESPEKTRREYIFSIIAGIFCGSAFLTKGFLAFAVPVLVFLLWMLRQRRFIDVFRMSWLPLLTALFVALPWAIQIHLLEKDFWQTFIWNEHLRRFLTEDAQFPCFFLSSLGYWPLMFLPWLLLVPALCAGFVCKVPEEGRLTAGGAETRLLHFSFLWLILSLLVFFCAEGKLFVSTFSCIPPFAILMALALNRCFFLRHGAYFQLGVALLGGILILTLFLLIFIQMFGFEGVRDLSLSSGGTPLYAETWKLGLAAGTLIASLLLTLFLWNMRGGIERAFLFGILLLPFYAAFWFVVPDIVEEQRMPGMFFEHHRGVISQDDIVISGTDSLGAVCWHFKRDNVYAVYWDGELDYAMKYEDASLPGVPRILSFEQIRKLIEEHPNRVVLVAKEKYLKHWRKELPPPLYEASSGSDGYGIMRL